MTVLQPLLEHFPLTRQSLQQLLQHNRLTTQNIQQLSERNRPTAQNIQQLLEQSRLTTQRLQLLLEQNKLHEQNLQRCIKGMQRKKERGLENGVLLRCSFRGCPYRGTMKPVNLRMHRSTCHRGEGFSTFHCSEKDCWNSAYPNGFRTRSQVLSHVQVFHNEVSTSVNVSPIA